MMNSSADHQAHSLRLTVQILYELTLTAVGDTAVDSVAAAVAGHRFEDEAADVAYTALVDRGIQPPTPPRRKLILPTLSGLHQEFDLVVTSGLRYCVVELKRRSHAEIEQVYAFVAKLLDYALAARIHRTDMSFTGLFVSTSPRLNDNIRQFSLTYGVLPIAADLIPCQVVQAASRDTSICADARNLEVRLGVPLPEVILSRDETSAHAMLLEWQSIALRYEQCL